MYRVYLRSGTTVTIDADSFSKTEYEVLFYDGEPKRQRNQNPDYEKAVAVFRHEELAGFVENSRVRT